MDGASFMSLRADTAFQVSKETHCLQSRMRLVATEHIFRYLRLSCRTQIDGHRAGAWFRDGPRIVGWNPSLRYSIRPRVGHSNGMVSSLIGVFAPRCIGADTG